MLSGWSASDGLSTSQTTLEKVEQATTPAVTDAATKAKLLDTA